MSRIFASRRVLRPLPFLLLALPLLGAEKPAPALPPAPATVAELSAQLEKHVSSPRFNAALWGVKIASLDTGRVLFEHHADRLLSPASNSKLYTSALALDRLGADYRIVTPLLGTAKPGTNGDLKGDLIVSGRGDPSWWARGTTKKFWDIFEPFVAALEKAGVRHVTGDLIADATWFHSLPNGSGWTADDLNDYYGAEISALTLEDNYAELRVTPAATPGQPCTLELVQPHTGLVLDNRTTTVAKGAPRRVTTQRIYGENVVHVFGELPAGDKEELVDVTVPRPAQWFAGALKEALARRGIRVDGVARSLRWPDVSAVTTSCVVLGEVSSPPLRELVTTLMKPSQNLETDLLFAHLGEKFRPADASTHLTAEDSAVRLLRDFLTKNKLPVEDVRFEEGSGLSRNNLTTANATVALLKFMATHRDGADYIAALPIAGVDGTLRRRLKGTAAEGNLRAKTGTLRYAISLSGFVTSAAGERLVFSLMLNRAVATPEHSPREDIDDIAVLLARFTGRSEPKAP